MHLWFGFCALNFFSILSDFLSREKLTQKIAPKAEQLQVTSRKTVKNSGNLLKLEFWSILLFKFIKLLSFLSLVIFVFTFSRERKLKAQNPNLMVGHRHRV